MAPVKTFKITVFGIMVRDKAAERENFTCVNCCSMKLLCVGRPVMTRSERQCFAGLSCLLCLRYVLHTLSKAIRTCTSPGDLSTREKCVYLRTLHSHVKRIACYTARVLNQRTRVYKVEVLVFVLVLLLAMALA